MHSSCIKMARIGAPPGWACSGSQTAQEAQTVASFRPVRIFTKAGGRRGGVLSALLEMDERAFLKGGTLILFL